MICYVGQTRGRRMIERLRSFGIGECTCRGELPPRRLPFFFDNGAFRDWKAGRPFDRAAFERDADRLRSASLRPDFLVLPDVVAGGVSSLETSLAWVDPLRDIGPLYLAVQDGMTSDHVEPCLDRVDGVFVGGTLGWKLETAAMWRELVHSRGKRLHVGRVGNPSRVSWARLEVKADSIDSSQPLWSNDNLDRFLAALASGQRSLFA